MSDSEDFDNEQLEENNRRGQRHARLIAAAPAMYELLKRLLESGPDTADAKRAHALLTSIDGPRTGGSGM